MRWFVLLAFGLAVLGAGSEAHACSCAQQTLKEGAAQAHAIFEGTVIEIGDNTQTDFKGREVTFAVKRAWKGIATEEATVITAASSAACGYPFVKGSTYLVYAYVSKAPRLRASLCSLTKPIDKAREDLKELGKPQREFADSDEKTKGGRCTAQSTSLGVEPPTLAALLFSLFSGASCRTARRDRAKSSNP